MTDQDTPVVLIAEDEPSVAEGYELWLGDRYEIRLAADGRETLDAVDDTVDVVLLDRMMPELSGKQVLSEIRERGVDCRVAMVTAVEPDFDVIEMGFDAYLTKPPDRQDLIDTIERLLDRATLDEAFREYHSLMARKGALGAQKTEEELEGSAEYRELLERIEAKREEVDATLGDMGSAVDFVGAVRELEDGDDDLDDLAGFDTEGDDP
jgi:DNA-binding response OmpR family regulator